MIRALAVLLGLVLVMVIPASARGCSEACSYYRFLGTVGYGCVTGSEGRNCISWGYACAIITSCQQTMLRRPDGSVLATTRLCRRPSRSRLV
jgi:hypothetical protein